MKIPRYIDADALNEMVDKINDTDYGSIFDYTAHREVRNVLRDIKHLIDNAPTIEAEPVRHGEWKKFKDEIYCSLCECTALMGTYGGIIKSTYCPHCGAKMDGGAK